jgi:hypothetical protein
MHSYSNIAIIESNSETLNADVPRVQGLQKQVVRKFFIYNRIYPYLFLREICLDTTEMHHRRKQMKALL